MGWEKPLKLHQHVWSPRGEGEKKPGKRLPEDQCLQQVFPPALCPSVSNLLPKPRVCPGEGFRIGLPLHQIVYLNFLCSGEIKCDAALQQKGNLGDLGSLVIFRDLVRLFFERSQPCLSSSEIQEGLKVNTHIHFGC